MKFTMDQRRILVLHIYTSYMLMGIEPSAEDIKQVIKGLKKELQKRPDLMEKFLDEQRSTLQ